MKEIYITGDTHGDFRRILEFCKRMNTTKEDIMIILGDAGINYHVNDKYQEWDVKLKELLKETPITLFCIHGNHEQRPYEIPTYEEEEWHGGVVYVEREYPSIKFAKDGEIYDFNGKKCLVAGGAFSVDWMHRRIHFLPWFDNEQPTEDIKRYVEQQADKVNWKVDYVFSHTAPLKYEPVEAFLPGIDQSRVDKSTEEWLDTLEDRLSYERWFFGHYHIEKEIDKMKIMFRNIEKL